MFRLFIAVFRRNLGGCIYTMSQEEMSIFWEVIVSVILSKRVYMYMCPIPNGLRDRAISLYSCKIVDKEILRIDSNIGIYCSSDKVGTIYVVQHIFENSTVSINALCKLCEDMLCCSSDCIWTFLYADVNIHYEIGQFVSCIQIVLCTSLFIQPHKQMSNGVHYGGNEG
jgi:hypothetical protein